MISRPPFYYRVAIKSLAPIYRHIVKRRSGKNSNYADEVADRFGMRYTGKLDVNETPLETSSSALNDLSKTHASKASIIWCHAVSLGETNTIAPVLNLLMAQGYRIWLTNTTQTGYARAQRLYANQINEGKLFHSYVPIDTPPIIRKFLNYVNPCAALFVETELWANTLHLLAVKDIPAILVNARLSEKSYKNYKKIAKTSQSMMHNLSLIIAQDELSAKRFRCLGAKPSQIRVAGSLKWTINAKLNHDDITHNPSAKSSFDMHRPIWVAASTHSGEESIALMVQKQLIEQAQTANALLILVPRHPERFDEVAQLIEAFGFSYARRSDVVLPKQHCQVYLADSMGELMQWYKTADLAFVGGSLVNVGGHNPVEAYVSGTPVVMGQFTQSCQGVVDDLVAADAMVQLTNAYTHKKGKSLDKPILNQASTALFKPVFYWLTHKNVATQAGEAGRQLMHDNQVILSQQVGMINEVIEAKNQALFEYLG
ncbi:3-deoxy-D-manno-octulosonic acid transferase [Psychrobacter sp. HD31]|uniref:3-deoxy-D-manno-octulosonic acid transferase n=1 Tax=Psychrobacter sp. HD31 TaxID=3112003 RepID=UPI003DA3FBA1